MVEKVSEVESRARKGGRRAPRIDYTLDLSRGSPFRVFFKRDFFLDILALEEDEYSHDCDRTRDAVQESNLVREVQRERQENFGLMQKQLLARNKGVNEIMIGSKVIKKTSQIKNKYSKKLTEASEIYEVVDINKKSRVATLVSSVDIHKDKRKKTRSSFDNLRLT